MNVSLLLAIAAVVIPGGLGWVGLRYVIRKDRADGAAAAQAEEDRQNKAIRDAVTDARTPLLTEIADLKVDNRTLRQRRDDLLDELRRQPPGEPRD